jgi:hypothetical protein
MRSMSGGRSIASLCAALLAAAPVIAQANDAPRLWWVHEERAKPSMVGAYEETTKEFVKMVGDHRAAMPTFAANAYQGDDFTYIFVSPVGTMAGAGALMGEFTALFQAAPQRAMDVMGRGGATMDSVADWIIEEHPELSYRPAAPRLKPEEVGFTRVDFYYLMPGREWEADALAKEFIALWKAKGITNGWRFYRAITGPDLPLLLVASDGKDAADFAAHDAKDLAAVGAEGQALFQKALAFTRRFEQRAATVRRDLSIPPPAAKR